MQRLNQYFAISLPEQPLNHLQLDSRAVQAGDVFIGLIGHQLDGRKFAAQAVAAGAAVVILESEDPQESGAN